MLFSRIERTAGKLFFINGIGVRNSIPHLRPCISFRSLVAPNSSFASSSLSIRDGQIRHMATDGKVNHQDLQKEKQQPILDPDSLYIVSVPITTHRSYIFCNHKLTFLDSSQKIPLYVRAEAKLTGLARKGWDKLRASNVTINKKVVVLVNRLLNTIPYDESCLQSFPAKLVMVREINEEHFKESPKTLITGKMDEKNVSVDQLKPIPVYHPRFQEALAICSQMHLFRNQFSLYHRKWAFWCGIGIPFTLPLALIPVMPNVPGFYLAYRFYCHIKALMGVKNMSYLLETKGDSELAPTPADTTHLKFQACPKLDVPYLADATFAKVKADDSNDSEQVLLTHETIDRIIDHSGLEQLRDDLHKALNQVLARLEKQLAEENVQ